MGESTRKRQGRPSRGIPTPLGYGYLTRPFREKQLSLTQTSLLPTESRCSEQEEKRRSFASAARVFSSGLGGRRKHTLQDDRILQARVFTPKGAVAPSASTRLQQSPTQPRAAPRSRGSSGNPARAGGSTGYPWGLGQLAPKGASPIRGLD